MSTCPAGEIAFFEKILGTAENKKRADRRRNSAGEIVR
jgi:hypothetical protein